MEEYKQGLRVVRRYDACGTAFVYPINRLNLDSCLRFLFEERRGHPYDSFEDAKSIRRICEEVAKEFGFRSMRNYLEYTRIQKHWKSADY